MKLRSTDWLASSGDAYTAGSVLSCKGWEVDEVVMRRYIFDIRVTIKEILDTNRDPDGAIKDDLQSDGTREI